MNSSILEFYLGHCFLCVRKACAWSYFHYSWSFTALYDQEAWCVQRLCAGLMHEESPAPLAFNYTCPSKKKKPPAEWRVAVLGESGSNFHCGCCGAHWNLVVLMSGGKNGLYVLSCPWRGEFVPTTVQETLTEEQTMSPPVFQASVRLLPSPHLCQSHLPAQ